MKSALLAAFAASAFVVVTIAGCGSKDEPVLAGSGGGDLEFDDFEEPLEDYGVWVEVDGYGTCWYPDDVDDDWRPYCHGHWVWTDDCGWYWVSDYEWGWACEHYGRWTHVHGRWHWVPGYEWSGAWVVWRDGDGYVGWAPLPPSVGWSVSVGISHDVHWDAVIYEPGWVFVAEVDFTAPRVRSVVVHDIDVVIHKTKVKGSISVSGGRAMNHAIKVHEAEKFTGKKVPHRKLEDASSHRGAKDDGEKVKAYRPKARKSDDRGGRDEKQPSRDTEKKPERDTKKEPSRETEKKPDRDTEKKPERDTPEKKQPEKKQPQKKQPKGKKK
jgi:hypothetical protein